MINDELGKRMKENYEKRARTYLTRRTPVAIRIDGKAFHSFTKGFEKPFDDVLIKLMQETTKYLCENIQGCVFGYTQSDEITLILTDYKKLTTDAWFDYQVQKICSIAASMATMKFNQLFANEVELFYQHHYDDFVEEFDHDGNKFLWTVYSRAADKGAMFDARCFNIPKEEVTNLIYWRQLDAVRNSIQMVGQANFSHKELMNKTCNQIQDMLITEKGINWNDYPVYKKHGSACYKSENGWIIDFKMPILKGENREYVDRWLEAEE